MKLLTKCLAAGSLAAIVLFTYKERFDIHTFFNAGTKANQAGANDKRDPLSPSAAPLQKTAPLILQAKTECSSQNRIEPSIKPHYSSTKQLLVSDNVLAESNNTVDFLSHAVLRPYKNVGFKKNIVTSKLIKKMSAETISMHLKTIIPSADSTALTALDNGIKAEKMPELIALKNSQPAKQEISSLQQEKVEMEAPITVPQKMAGTAYEGGVIAISPKIPANINNTISKAETKSEKNSQKATNSVNIPEFASLKQADNGTDTYSYASLYDGTEKLKEYAASSGSNTDYAIIINLGIKSGKKRFFVIDFSTNTIVKSGIVAEGSGDVYSSYEKRYSNEIGSMASSLGIYKIGKRIKSNVNYSYRLYGMQESNSNAFKRSMMLQGSEDIPYDEISLPLLKTDGSLSLSARLLKEISPMLDASAKPVLLWAYDPSTDSQPLYSAIQKNK